MTKKIYDYALSRLKADDYIREMNSRFGISIVDKSRGYKGFIKYGVYYEIFIPIVIDGEFSLRRENCRRIAISDIVSVKKEIKKRFVQDPGTFQVLYNYFSKWRKTHDKD